MFEDLDALPAAGGAEGCDEELTANAALASIFRSLIPTAGPAELHALALLEATLRAGPRATRLARRVRPLRCSRGRDVADAIFAWSKGDGGHEGYLRNFPPYAPPAGPGLWVPTPPSFLSALQPSWGGNRCFAIANGAAYPPGDHPRYGEERRSRFGGEATRGLRCRQLADERAGGHRPFWSDDPGATATPPGHSVSIATQVLRQERAGLATAAETYARVGMAVSDAFVACWYQKFRYNLLRPVTYTRRSSTRLAAAARDAALPGVSLGHSVQSGAAC